MALYDRSGMPPFRARQVGSQIPRNLLLYEKRWQHKYFDNDGAGHLAWEGPRHDNDHADYRQIRILPTADEILAITRLVFMPKKDIVDPYYHLPYGLSRLFDTHFRHLRYDSTESIRDICYDALFLTSRYNGFGNNPENRTMAGNRYYLYTDAEVQGLIPSERNGIMINVSFRCPKNLRGQRIHKSGRLESGKLCALIAFNKSTRELSILYFDIHLRQSTFALSPRGLNSSKAAVQLSIPDCTAQDELLQIMRLANNLCADTQLLLIEFPNVLRVGFQEPLQCLQKMGSEDVSFSRYLVPNVNDELIDSNHMTISPPKYASQPGHTFDLTVLTSDKLEAKFPAEAFTGKWLKWTLGFITQHTTLDEGQAAALCDGLSRELAFIQGPPGTGKTFLGVALIQVLLASRLVEEEKPILVVCLTNHALDSFMAGLRDAGVESLLRIGNGSKEEWTRAINLYQKSRKHRYKHDEHQERRGILSQKTHLFNEISNWCNGVTKKFDDGQPAWIQLAPILKKYYPQSYSQLTTGTDSITAQVFTFDYWASGGDLIHIKNLHQELAQRFIETSAHHVHHLQKNFHMSFFQDCDTDKLVLELLETISSSVEIQSSNTGDDNLWRLPYEKRQSLLTEWNTHIDEEGFAHDLVFLQTQHQELRNAEKQSRELRDVRVMRQQNVIGITTTACAARRDVLRDIAPDIMICEEAGEVMEAHALCSLLPSLKQAIFIGDPLQLRPEINERQLTLETEIGAQYRLDESLFERFMAPRNPDALVMPTSQLNIQRRMHPHIADICRLTYPFLKDHESTLSHPVPKGLTERIFWLDHQMPEAIDTTDHSDSIHNPYEVDIVKGFVQYLMRGSEYSLGDIAVLTPYTAQLKRLTNALASTCSIWLSPNDRELLLDAGQIDMEEENLQTKMDVAMSEMLRIATVDNFQGEEARVIILSTVRSGGKPGFLKTENRINVACSRARDGFYIIGNAETLQTVPMWNNVIEIFNTDGRRGPRIKLQCDRHHDHHGYASNAADFAAFPECSNICNSILSCGHLCTEICHDPELHTHMPCEQRCNKTFSCGHACQKMCSTPCGRCDIGVENVLLSCGHNGKKLCSGAVKPCEKVVDIRSLPCNRHKLEMICGRPPEHVCENICGVSLKCGHICLDSCNQCVEAGKHRACTEECQKVMECGHRCKEICHTNQTCPPCRLPCAKKCTHGQCGNICSEPCIPCVKVNNITTKNDTGKIMCCLQNSPNPVDVIDRLLLKFAKKFDSFACAIQSENSRLTNSFHQLMSDLRLNPLGARGNTTLLLSRERKLIDIQKQVVSYKANAIDMALKSIEDLENLPCTYLIMSRFQFNVLELRAINLRLNDKAHTARELLRRSSEDPSQDTLRQVINSIQFIYTECIACVYHCQTVIEDPRLRTAPCLEAEIRLHQVRLRLLARGAELRLWEQSIRLSTEIECSIPDSDFQNSLNRVEWIAQHLVSGWFFLKVVQELRDFLPTGTYGNEAFCGDDVLMDDGEIIRLENHLVNHKLGQLVACSKFSHPYSKTTFPEFCPDCGQWQDTEEERYKKDQLRMAEETAKAKKYLHEEAFLQAMKEKNSSRVPQKELTPEEKFLEVLNKMRIKH